MMGYRGGASSSTCGERGQFPGGGREDEGDVHGNARRGELGI